MQNVVCESRTTCRLCASDTLELVLWLAATPPANALAPSAESAIAAERYPLDRQLLAFRSAVRRGRRRHWIAALALRAHRLLASCERQSTR